MDTTNIESTERYTNSKHPRIVFGEDSELQSASGSSGGSPPGNKPTATGDPEDDGDVTPSWPSSFIEDPGELKRSE